MRTEVPEVFRALWTQSARYKILYGGRGSGKSYALADYCIVSMLRETEPYGMYACCRRTMTSLRESVKSLIMARAYALGLSAYFHTSQSSRYIHCSLNNCKFFFTGIQNTTEATKMKSLHNLRKVWLEEAHDTLESVWDILTPSVRGSEDSEILVSFNPDRKSDYIYDRFVVNEPPAQSLVIKANYYDNPFFSEVLNNERKACLIFPNKYQRIWEGKPGFVEKQILKPEWWLYYDNLQDAINVCTGMFITADTAFKKGTLNDYSVFQCWAYNGSSQIYLIAQVRKKLEFPELVAGIQSFAASCMRLDRILKPRALYIEDKVSGISLVQTLKRVGIQAIGWKPRDYKFPEDKVGRVSESSWILSRGVVYLGRHMAGVSDFVDECSEFSEDGSTGHDDQVDAFTMAMSVWRSMGGGIGKHG